MVFLSFDGVLNDFQLTAFLVSQSMHSSIVVGQPVYYRKQLLNAAICFFGFTYHMMRKLKKLHRKLLQTIIGPSSSTEVQRGPEETITVHKWILEQTYDCIWLQLRSSFFYTLDRHNRTHIC